MTMNIKDYIRDTSRMSHAYIISGTGDAPLALALAVSQAMVCSSVDKPCRSCTNCQKAQKSIHPDIIHIEKSADKREILVSQARSLRSDAYVIPNEADKKVYIIHDADTMNPSAQNALLKILEEPPAHLMFILATTGVELCALGALLCGVSAAGRKHGIITAHCPFALYRASNGTGKSCVKRRK